MIDIKLIRENPDLVKENIKKKFQDKKLPVVDEVIELDKKKARASAGRGRSARPPQFACKADRRFYARRQKGRSRESQGAVKSR